MGMTAPTSNQAVQVPGAIMLPVSRRWRRPFALQPNSGADNIVWGTLSQDSRIARKGPTLPGDMVWLVPSATICSALHR
jgi:hypothetical protein